MTNNFTITFGQQPSSYISRVEASKRIYNDFLLDFPLSHIYIISGVRGAGKTVLLTNVSNKIKTFSDWIVIDINPNREILAQVAAGLYENTNVKHLFLSKSFSFSFHGFGFSIEGKEPVSNIKTIVEKMLDVVKKHNKKVLITIDEVSNNSYMRAFAHDFQSFLRDDYPVFSLMTGLYENVNSLQSNKDLTFLYRAPKIDLKPLKISLIEKEYKKIYENTPIDVIKKLAELTKGYAFAYQVAGFLFGKYGKIEKMLEEFDQYMATYVYDKIWSKIPNNEKLFLRAFENDLSTTEIIMEKTKFDNKTYSVYRSRLINRGIIEGIDYGKNEVILPRFVEYIAKQLW